MLIHASAAPQMFRNWVGWRQEIMWKGSGRVGTWGTAIAIKDAQIANARLVLFIDSAPVSQLRPSMRDQRSPAVACRCPAAICAACHLRGRRSEEHTSELQSLMRRSYAVFCLKKKKKIIK